MKDEKSGRILIISDSPTIYSGLGRVVKNLARRFSEEYHVIIGAWHYNLEWYDAPYLIYPVQKDTYEQEKEIKELIDKFRPDTVIVIGDLWYFYFVPAVKKFFIDNGLYIKWVGYLTVDGDPLPKRSLYHTPKLEPLDIDWVNILNSFDQVITCTHYGKKQICKLVPNLPVDVVYLGWDSSVLKQRSKKEIEEFKRSNNWLDLSDVFVCLVDAQNTTRKNIVAAMGAFDKFQKNKRAILFINTDPLDLHGPNLYEERTRLSCSSRIVFNVNKEMAFTGLSDKDLALIYNVADCLILPSCNEGFGLPLLQAQAVETIPIATDYSANSEIVQDRGYLTKPSAYLSHEFGIRRAIADENAIADALTDCYEKWKNGGLEELYKKGERFSSLHTWDKKFKELESKIFGKKTEVKVILPLKVGVMVPMNEICGIGEHTKFYLDHLKTQHTIYAPAKESTGIKADLSADASNVVRCWDREFNDYSQVIEGLKRDKISILHVQHEFSFFKNINNFIKFLEEVNKLGIKVIVTLHTVINVGSLIERLRGLSDKITIAFEERYVNKESFSFLGDNFGAIAHAVPSFPDEDRKEVRKELKIESNHVIGHIGFLNQHKGLHNIVSILPGLKKIYPDITYLIVGTFSPDSEYAEKLGKQIDELGVADRVKTISKFFPLNRVVHFLHACDMIVLYYSVPYVSASGAVNVAMASKRPVLTSDSPMFSNLSDEVFKTPRNNLGALQENVLKVFQSESLQKRLVRSSDLYVQEHDPKKIAERYDKLYEEIYNG